MTNHPYLRVRRHTLPLRNYGPPRLWAKLKKLDLLLVVHHLLHCPTKCRTREHNPPLQRGETGDPLVEVVVCIDS
jgi:hypothetical protein